MKPTVLTAVFGGYDTLKDPVPQSVECDWVCVTDDPFLRSNTWKIERHIDNEGHPRTRAKIPKFLPWMYNESDYSIWVDASAEIISPTFVEEALAALGSGSMAQFIHPHRDCIYEEAKASIGLPKYKDLPIEKQVEAYRAAGHPPHWGLWATGVIVRQHDEEQKVLGREWLTQCRWWTYQDQLSEPHILRQLGIRPVSLPHHLVDNPWLRWHGHASDN